MSTNSWQNNNRDFDRDSSMSRSRSFSYDRRGDQFNRRGDRRGNYSGRQAFSRYREPSPELPERTEPVKFIKLEHDFTPSMSPQEQKEFLNTNQIKLLGSVIPSPAATFEELNLPENLLKHIKSNKWEAPTPIQAISIPVALKGHDLIGIAKTGSGKTGSFLIPALLHIQAQEPMLRGDGPIVIILSPTRELAQQIAEVANTFTAALKVRCACLFGGASRGPQLGELRRQPHIIIATPGRLNDFISAGAVNMNRVNFLILDEADRMLDMGFEPQIRSVIDKITPERQTIMFSATWPKEIRKLASDFLVDPVHMVIGSNELSTNSNILQKIERCEEFEKLTKTLEFLKGCEDKKIIIFTKTKRSADDLCENLHMKGMSALAIHGDKAQNQRDYVLNKYRNAKTGVLVATDVAARGLDVTDIDMVINFDFPGDIESYIHRIGRTARGNKEGTAITLFTPENKNMSRKLHKVLVNAKQEIPEWLAQMVNTTPKGAHREGYGRGGRGYGGGRGFGGGGYGGGYGGGGYGGNSGGYGGGYGGNSGGFGGRQGGDRFGQRDVFGGRPGGYYGNNNRY